MHASKRVTSWGFIIVVSPLCHLSFCTTRLLTGPDILSGESGGGGVQVSLVSVFEFNLEINWHAGILTHS